MGLISFGKITKTHGLAGELKLLPHSRSLHSFDKITKIFIDIKTSSAPNEYIILSMTFHKNTAILKLRGVDSVEKAQNLSGCEVFIEESELGELEEDEFYFSELIGLKAFTEDGTYLGKVEDIMERTIQSILIIKNEEKELLIPMADPIVKEVNLEEGIIVIAPIKGMLE